MMALLLLSLAYWWLENLPHELFGMAIFGLLAWHLAVNRLWFKNLLRGQYDARRMAIVMLHMFLVLNMLVLLATSIVISKTIFAALPIPDNIYLRDVLWFAAYWVMVIVGIHLGLHWTRVMALMRSALKLSQQNASLTVILRLTCALLAGLSVWSFEILDIWSKLTFTYSLDVWNFKTSVTPFFGHWACVVALPAILTHYSMTFWRKRQGIARPAGSQP